MSIKNIGLALSGGGIRAAVFHLGVIKWMAENKMLGNISKISSVSGASLAIGLIFSHNLFKWPTDSEFIDIV
jgi:NTE family protein